MKCINCGNLKNGWCEKIADSPCPEIERDCIYFMRTNDPMMHFIHTSFGYCYYHLDRPVEDGGTYLIYGLYVYDKYRQKGHSKRMLKFLIDEIRGTGYDGAIYIKAEPEENSISVSDLVRYYRGMGLSVCDEEACADHE